MRYQSETETKPDASLLQERLGKSSALKEICTQIQQVAPTDCTVLLIGETGTGKSTFVNSIHELSNRSDQPLIYMNCATPPETSIEAEIFGVDRKTRPGHNENSLEHLASVNGATLVIDEISELSPEGQANLLETLDLIEKHNANDKNTRIDIRLIVTSQHDLEKLVAKGAFNRRLFFHLSIFTIRIPPLRKRSSELVSISEKVLRSFCKKYGKPNLSFSPAAIDAITHYCWPGNYRELRNTLERIVILARGNSIDASQLMLNHDALIEQQNNSESADPADGAPESPPQNLSLDDYFRHFVLEHQDHLTETQLAKKLGISRKSLWERRQRYGIPRRKPAGKG